MKLVSQTKILILAIIFFFSLIGGDVFAQNDPECQSIDDDASIVCILKNTAVFGAKYDANTNSSSLAITAGRVTAGALSLLGLIFISLTVYAGYLWMTAQGKSDQVDTAKEILQTAIVGLFVIMAAFALTTLIYSAL